MTSIAAENPNFRPFKETTHDTEDYHVNKSEAEFYEAVLILKTHPEACEKFMRDLLTPTELKAIKERLHVAILLSVSKLSYKDIYEKTLVSIATITRVARFLHHENNHGYKIMIDRFKTSIEKGDKVDLYDMILALTTSEECQAFFSDLCTPSEIKAMRGRLRVARLLFSTNLSYRQIHEITGVSVATITRVARALYEDGHNGYIMVLKYMKVAQSTRRGVDTSNQS